MKRSEIAPANQSRLSLASAGEEQFQAFWMATWRAGQRESRYHIDESKAFCRWDGIDGCAVGVGPVLDA